MNLSAQYRQAPAPLACVPLRTAFLCMVCKCITDSAPAGVCQLCGSSTVRSVSSLLQSSDERRNWLVLVNGGVQTWEDDEAIEEVPIG